MVANFFDKLVDAPNSPARPAKSANDRTFEVLVSGMRSIVPDVTIWPSAAA